MIRNLHTWCTVTWRRSHLIVLVIDWFSPVHLDRSNTRVGDVVPLLSHKPGSDYLTITDIVVFIFRGVSIK